MAQQLSFFGEPIRDPAPNYRELGSKAAKRALKNGVLPEFPNNAPGVALIHGVAFSRKQIEQLLRRI